ncbi:DUF3422 family protein [Roseateles violae]|uniref:DUF3422 domain-containing protein n=1 Tax=Roseateles violae TaxID=3058042 RepID=A0ABT8DNE2_9BURK|nr:DUF3422 domain-containing protein [Pelomonas sp. PFR6]MDN3919473.1 DUF3422 domain-containing protein [Pelomonas sp. PFR6]
MYGALTQHAQRIRLHNEVHERPPEPLSAPLSISHIVMLCDREQLLASREHLARLLRDQHLAEPGPDTTHLRMDLGSYRLRWELHTEFVSWTFSRTLADERFDAQQPATALAVLPQDWLAALPGACLVGLHLWLLADGRWAAQDLARGLLSEDSLLGSAVAGGEGQVFTDFATHADGFSRMLVLPGKMAPRRLGRLVQRLLEIETYRMAALLGLPVAREASAMLGAAEHELAELAQAIRSARREQEPELLDRLTRLAAKVEGGYAATHSRFSASTAYFELMEKRIADIAETRLPGLQTIAEFMERRLTPAKSTCEWAARRQTALSERISRVSNLLRTRVEIEQQVGIQALLAAMNRRQDLQLKLQAMVEGLSVAAISYYIVGLISYLAKGAQKIGWPFGVETTSAVAVPVVALVVWALVRRAHRVIVGH